jgi:peptidoglycan hydrolase-like protein with peptidoglycan-binding domain
MSNLSLTHRYKYKLKAFKIRRAARLEIHDLLFNHDSDVMMPGALDASTPEASGLQALAVGFLYAEQNTDKVVLIAGHTDASGPDDYNVKLSWRRGENVYFLFKGERSKWVDASDKRDKVEDRQHILKWLTRDQGWDCDPGKKDNKDGPKTREALKKFQQQYNSKFGKSIKEDGLIGKETWGAFYDVYESITAELLDTDASGLGSYRGKLKWLESGKESVGCGESFPLEAAGVQGLRSQTNRRVEVLFFDKDDPITTDCHSAKDQCDPEKCLIYKSGTLRITPIPVTPQPIKVHSLQMIVLGWNRTDKKDEPVAERPWTSHKPVAMHGKTAADGLIKVGASTSDAEGALNVDLYDPPPAAAADAAVAGSATDYPIKIKSDAWVDKNTEPVLPPADDRVVKWKLKIVTLESLDNDDGIKARMHNLGFACDSGSDDETTRAAVKAYQALYMDEPDGSGDLNDIQDDVKKRHDKA